MMSSCGIFNDDDPLGVFIQGSHEGCRSVREAAHGLDYKKS